MGLFGQYAQEQPHDGRFPEAPARRERGQLVGRGNEGSDLSEVAGAISYSFLLRFIYIAIRTKFIYTILSKLRT